MLIEYFPRGEVFVRSGEKPLDFLYLIERGAVRIFTRQGREENLLDLRAEGDSIGVASLLNNAPPAFNASAEEDTICYLVPRARFLELAENHPPFRLFSRRIPTGEPNGSVVETATEFTAPAGELVQRRAVSCRREHIDPGGGRLMTRHLIGAMVVLGADGKPEGIFTDRDLRRVVAEGLDGAAPVTAIMRPSPVSVREDEPCLNALLTMVRMNIHHVVVVDRAGRFKGVITRTTCSCTRAATRSPWSRTSTRPTGWMSWPGFSTTWTAWSPPWSGRV